MPHETLAAVVSTMQTHFLFEGVTAFRPMLFRPASVKWTLSEKAVSLKVSALMDGLEGTEMFEYGHIIAFQCVSFDPAKYLATTTLINNYVRTKTRLLQKMEKLDFRSQLVHRVGEGTAREVIAKSMGAGRERRASTARPATSSAALSGLGALAAPERAAPERARRASASSRVSEAWGSLQARPCSLPAPPPTATGAPARLGARRALSGPEAQDEVLVEEDYGEDEEEEGSGGAGAPGAGGSAPRHGRVLSGSGASLQRAVAEAAQRQLAFFSRAPAVLHHPQRKVTHRRPWSYSGAGQVPAPAPAALGAAPRAGGAGAGAPWSARSLLETAAEAGGAEAGGTTRGASAAAPGGVATGAETGRGAGGADRQALKLMGGTVEDRVARRILEAQPSKTTTRLAAGLLAGTAERAASANRVEGRFLSRDSAANRGRIPSASVANRIARDVELSCGGGSVGREERSRVSEALEYRLAREARAEAIGASDARARATATPRARATPRRTSAGPRGAAPRRPSPTLAAPRRPRPTPSRSPPSSPAASAPRPRPCRQRTAPATRPRAPTPRRPRAPSRGPRRRTPCSSRPRSRTRRAAPCTSGRTRRPSSRRRGTAGPGPSTPAPSRPPCGADPGARPRGIGCAGRLRRQGTSDMRERERVRKASINNFAPKPGRSGSPTAQARSRATARARGRGCRRAQGGPLSHWSLLSSPPESARALD